MRGKFTKRIAFGVAVLWCIGGAFYLAGVIGGKYKQTPVDILFPKKMYPTPVAMDTCNRLYAFAAPDGMRKPWKKHYNRQEFDQLLGFAFYPDIKPYDWLVNASALGAMYYIEIPRNNPSLKDYEIAGITKAAVAFIEHPQPGIRWESAQLVATHHLKGAVPAVAEALRTEKNALVAHEMNAALRACGE